MVRSEITTKIFSRPDTSKLDKIPGQITGTHLLWAVLAVALWVNWFALLRLNFRIYSLESEIIGMHDLTRRVRMLEADAKWQTFRMVNPETLDGNTVTK